MCNCVCMCVCTGVHPPHKANSGTTLCTQRSTWVYLSWCSVVYNTIHVLCVYVCMRICTVRVYM